MKTKQELLEMIKQMEQNTFLLPDNWSDYIQLKNTQEKYKSYVGKRGQERYICFEYVLEDKSIIKIKISQDSISVENIDIFEPLKNYRQKISYVLENIYKEVYSFSENGEELRKIRQEIGEREDRITKEKEEIKKLKQRLIDFNSLNKVI